MKKREKERGAILLSTSTNGWNPMALLFGVWDSQVVKTHSILLDKQRGFWYNGLGRTSSTKGRRYEKAFIFSLLCAFVDGGGLCADA